MSVSAADQSPFAMADKLFPDSYFGQTEPVKHHLPIYSEGDSPSFKDVLDTVNPLQHIPLVSTIYRRLTGDQPGAGARLAGGALYGGPIGLFGELINCAIDDNTGKDVGETALAMVEDAFGGSSSDAKGSQTRLADQNDSAPASTAAVPPAPPQPDATPAQLPPTQLTGASEPPAPVAAPRPAVATQPLTAAGVMASDGTFTLSNAPAAPAAVQVSPQPSPADADGTAARGPTANAPIPNPPATLAMAHGRPVKFMPVPERHAVQPVQPPPLAAAVSTNGAMSHVPITGKPTYTASAPYGTMVQQALDKQAQLEASHGAGGSATPPPPTPAPAPASTPAATPTAGKQDWFTAAMSQALDKYQKAGSLIVPPAAAATTGAAP